jgi:hypothetical protein
MATSEKASSPAVEESLVRRESGIRRVFLYISIFFVAAITGVIMEEADKFLHLIDDVALVALSVVAIALIAGWWKRPTLPPAQDKHYCRGSLHRGDDHPVFWHRRRIQ